MSNEQEALSLLTLKDGASGVEVSGMFTSASTLQVTAYAADSAEFAAAAEACGNDLLAYYAIRAEGEQQAPYKVSIPLPEAYREQNSIDIRMVSGETATRINAYVVDGCVEFMTSVLGAFAILEPTAPGGNYSYEAAVYVAPDGSDDNDGRTLETPVRTIEKARQIVRTLNSDMQDNIVVFLRGGKYYLDAQVNFDGADSGTNGYDVVYTNYNGEEVEILAAKPVTGWTEAGTAGGHTIYSAQVGRDIFALYEGDEAAIMARREGYARSKGYDGSNKFTFDPNEVTFAADEKPSNLFVNYWPGAETYGADGAGYWINSVVRVLSIDGNVATIESPYHQVHTNSRYFFYNVKGELDEPGEFYYDFETGMVYYIPRGDIADVEIVAPTATRAFSLVGTADSKVHNITFDGLKIGKTNFTDQYLWPGSTGNYMTYETAGIEAVIYANHDYNLTIVNCAVNNAGVTGITFDDYSQGNTVLNTTITDSGFAGILMQAPAPTTISQYVNRNHTVMDCVIDTVGTRILHGGAIEIIQSGDNVITHNKLTNGPRMGIAIYGGFWESGGFQDTVIDGVEVTIDNVQDWMFARNNLFAYNDISRFMLDSEDGGVFYCQGGGRGNVVDHNLITDYGNETSGGIGIYLDDRADYFTITNNIVAQGNTSKTYAAYFKGHDNVIRNNLFLADSSRYPVVYFATFNNEPNHTLTFEKNILVQYGSSRKLIDFYDQWTADDQPARFASCDYNTYYLAGHEAGDEIFRVGSFYTFEEWKETFRVDAHSVLANPLLNEADYTVGEDSPALELGFVNIDIGEIGPRGSGGVQPEPDPDPNPDPDPDPENPDVPHTGVPAAVTAALAVCAAALTGLVLVRRKRRTFARPR